jgi:hypothetical protein
MKTVYVSRQLSVMLVLFRVAIFRAIFNKNLVTLVPFPTVGNVVNGLLYNPTCCVVHQKIGMILSVPSVSYDI